MLPVVAQLLTGLACPYSHCPLRTQNTARNRFLGPPTKLTSLDDIRLLGVLYRTVSEWESVVPV